MESTPETLWALGDHIGIYTVMIQGRGLSSSKHVLRTHYVPGTVPHPVNMLIETRGALLSRSP